MMSEERGHRDTGEARRCRWDFCVPSLEMSTFALDMMAEFPISRVVYRGYNNANAAGGVSNTNANNDASASNSNVGSRLANCQSVPRQGRTCPSIPHRGGQATAKAHIKWKAGTSSVGQSLVGRTKARRTQARRKEGSPSSDKQQISKTKRCAGKVTSSRR